MSGRDDIEKETTRRGGQSQVGAYRAGVLGARLPVFDKYTSEAVWVSRGEVSDAPVAGGSRVLAQEEDHPP